MYFDSDEFAANHAAPVPQLRSPGFCWSRSLYPSARRGLENFKARPSSPCSSLELLLLIAPRGLPSLNNLRDASINMHAEHRIFGGPRNLQHAATRAADQQ